MNDFIILDLVGNYKVTFSLLNTDLYAKVESKSLKITWVGTFNSISPPEFQYLKSIPSLLQRKLFINRKTLEIKICRGLLGSGNKVNKAKWIQTEQQAEEKYEKLEKSFLEQNEEKAAELSLSVNENIKTGTLNIGLLESLADINAYTCSNPNLIFLFLFKITQNKFIWTSDFYSYCRQVLTKKMRKFLFMHFIKNSGHLFPKSLQVNMIEKLEEATKILIKKTVPELSVIFELKIIRKLLLDSKAFEKYWKVIVSDSVELMAVFKSLKIINPAIFISEVSKRCNFLRSRFEGTSAFLIKFELFDVFEQNSEEIKEEMKKVLEFEFIMIERLRLEECFALIEFLRNCVVYERIPDEFLLEILKVVQRLSESDQWEVREQTIKMLKVLRVNKDKVIGGMAKKIIGDRKKKEQDLRVRICIKSKPYIPNPNEDQKIRYFVHQNHNFCIQRKKDSKNIHNLFKETNFVVIYGPAGVGKSWLAYQYCDQFKFKYEKIVVIESLQMINLKRLTEAFEITQESKTEGSLYKKMKSKQRKILLLFDGFDEMNQLREYYNANINVKYLVSSRRREGWPFTFDIGPVDFKDIKRSLMINLESGNDEIIDQLFVKIKDWVRNLDLAEICNILGSNYFNKKDYFRAEGYFLEEIQIIEKQIPRNYQSLTSTFKDLYELYKATHQYDKSKSSLHKYIDLAQKVYPRNHPTIISAYNTLHSLNQAHINHIKSHTLINSNLNKINEQEIAQEFYIDKKHLKIDKTSPIYEDKRTNFSVSVFPGTYKNLKIIAKKYSSLNKDLQADIGREIEIHEKLSKLSSKKNCFVKFYGTYYTKKSITLVIEAFSMNLETKIQEMKEANMFVDERKFLKIAYRLVHSFGLLKELSIVHSDIKSSNIAVNEKFQTKIMNYHCSSVKDPEKCLTSKSFKDVRSKYFLAPEMDLQIETIENREDIDNLEKADVYSLGLVLLNLLTLWDFTDPSFNKNNAAQDVENKLLDFSGETKTFLKKMLTVDPKIRPNFDTVLSYIPLVQITEEYK